MRPLAPIPPTMTAPQRHPGYIFLRLMLACFFLFILSGCLPTQAQIERTIQVTLQVDGRQEEIQIPAGTTAQGVLDQAKI